MKVNGSKKTMTVRAKKHLTKLEHVTLAVFLMARNKVKADSNSAMEASIKVTF